MVCSCLRKIFLLTKSYLNNLITVLVNNGLLLRKESFFNGVVFQKLRGLCLQGNMIMCLLVV
jgi:hypothetical protein